MGSVPGVLRVIHKTGQSVTYSTGIDLNNTSSKNDVLNSIKLKSSLS